MEPVYQPKRNQSRRHQQHIRTSSCDCYPACKSGHCKNSKSSSLADQQQHDMYNSIDPPDNEYDEESACVLLVQRANNRSSNGRNKGEGPRRRVSHTSSTDSPSIASSQYNDPPSNGSGPSICYSSSSDDDSEVGTRDPPLRSDSNDDTGKRGRQGEGRRGEKRGGLQRRDVHFASSSSSQQRRPRETGSKRGQNNRGKRAIIVDAEDVSHLTISQNYIDTIDQVSIPNDYYDVEAGEVVYDVQTKKKDGRSQRGERRRRVSIDSQSTIASSVESRDTLLKSMMSTVSADESSIISGIRGGQHNKYMNNNLSKSINKAKQTKGKMVKGKKSNGFISSYLRPISFYNMHNIQRAQLNSNNKSKKLDGRLTFFQRLFPSAIKEEEEDDDSIHSSSTSSTSSTNSTISNNSTRTTKSQASQRSKIGRVANSLLMTWVFTLLGAMIILVVYDKLEPLIVKLMHYGLHDVDGGSGVGEVIRKLINARHAIFHLDAKVDADVESGSSSFLT